MKCQTEILDRIDALYEAYFDGRTTVEQESELRRLLADHPELTGRRCEELRAVMGLFAAARRHDRPVGKSVTKHPSLRRRIIRPVVATLTSAAAVVAIIVATGTQEVHAADPDICFTRIGNNLIDNPGEVTGTALSELRLMGDALDEVNDNVADELSMIREAMNEIPQ